MTITAGARVDAEAIADAVVRATAVAPPEELKGCEFVANWLVNRVGIGGTFEMSDLRGARPDAQIDRRLRDLRPMGWVIQSSKDVKDLEVGLYRLDRIGTLTPPPAVSGRVRREVFESDHHRCVICGVAAGESYPDAPGLVARLQIGHIRPKAQGGSLTDRSNLRTECERCNAAVGDNQLEQVTLASVRAQVQNLKATQKSDLLGWIRAGARSMRADEQAYYRWMRLSPEARQNIEDYLETFIGEV